MSLTISVVIIAYNLQDYVAAALLSVLQQSRRADEIIVVDDASTDQTVSVLEQYHQAIQLIKMPQNSGAFMASLIGVKAAKGDICCMLDGDDIWALNKLETVENYWLAHPDTLLLSHHHIRVDAKANPLSIKDDTHRNIERIVNSTTDIAQQSALFKDSILGQKGYWMGSAYSFRRNALDIPLLEQQISDFPELKHTYLDMVVCPFLVLTAQGNIGYTAHTFFYYRIHASGSLGNNATIAAAKKSLHKGRAISRLILHICIKNKADKQYLELRQMGLLYYDYLECLYEKKYTTAFSLFVRLARKHWNFRQIIKETQRMLATVLLGPERFLTIKTKYA